MFHVLFSLSAGTFEDFLIEKSSVVRLFGFLNNLRKTPILHLTGDICINTLSVTSDYLDGRQKLFHSINLENFKSH